MTNTTHTRTRRCRTAGFTLAEVLVAAVLMGLAIIALVAAFGYNSVVTQRGEDVTVGTFLAEEIHGMAFQMSLEETLGMDGTTFSPAVLSTGVPYDSGAWSQYVLVAPVSITDLNATVAPETAKAARITVEVRLRGTPVVTQTSYRFDMEGVPFTDLQNP
ncbi:MAG TPA: hypothetical protein VM238_20215 [Phycisphaerae bacterium]|nr:hypothetical protein [Phycisphaerae bacterium]